MIIEVPESLRIIFNAILRKSSEGSLGNKNPYQPAYRRQALIDRGKNRIIYCQLFHQ